MSKWMWCMEWCRSKGFPPADQFFWEMAEKDYLKEMECIQGE